MTSLASIIKAARETSNFLLKAFSLLLALDYFLFSNSCPVGIPILSFTAVATLALSIVSGFACPPAKEVDE